MGVRSFNRLLDSLTQDKDPVFISKPKSLKAGNLKVFVFFSVIIAITTSVLLQLFKRKLVGGGSLTSEIITIIGFEVDLSDYLPKLTRNS